MPSHCTCGAEHHICSDCRRYFKRIEADCSGQPEVCAECMEAIIFRTSDQIREAQQALGAGKITHEQLIAECLASMRERIARTAHV